MCKLRDDYTKSKNLALTLWVFCLEVGQMAKQDFVKYHLREALCAGIAQMGSDMRLAKRLQAEVKLRLIGMSDDELWELAKLTADPPLRPVELAYEDHKRRVEELRATASEWMHDLAKRTAPDKEGKDG